MILHNEHDFHYRDMFTASGRDNLTLGEHTALKQLQNMANPVIKPADKGGVIVFQPREQYLQVGLRQLADLKFHTKQEFDTTDIHKNTLQPCIRMVKLILVPMIISFAKHLFFTCSPKSIKEKCHFLVDPSSLLQVATQRKCHTLWITF